MYFNDLSSYTYMSCGSDLNALSVGWLDELHDFPKGSVSERLLTRILALCYKPINQTRGFHLSPFLKPAPFGYPVEFKGKKMLLGSAEIRVQSNKGKSYAAPNLIYHYVKDCCYLPPQEFLDALNSMENVE
jgi:hypothetical protein